MTQETLDAIEKVINNVCEDITTKFIPCEDKSKMVSALAELVKARAEMYK